VISTQWTAVNPKQKEKHFIVTSLHTNEKDQIVGCDLEAVTSKTSYEIVWQVLKNSQVWLMGWK
jgi:tryptophan-rich hypothetical protein